ncbi:MAG: polysaccharide deacetylase family protein [Verrucomicrobiota bacterium]
MKSAGLTKLAFLSLAFAVCCLATPSAHALDPAKVVIIKADDFRGPSQGWTNFLQVSRQAGVKVGIGVIVTSIAGNATTAQWMRGQEAAGDVEFWNHGWDHLQWTDGSGQVVSEFKGSGLSHMQQHLADSQAGLSNALGKDVLSFGTPYNGFDTNTATVINATPALRLFYSSAAAASSLLDSRVKVVRIISESDGTGMPNAAKFQATFPPGSPGPVALQFHPSNSNFASRLTEYQQILQYLLTNGYSMLLPSEFVAPETPPLFNSIGTGADGGFTASGTGPAGAGYRIFATTNLALPFSNWSAVTTGSFSGGVFNFADAQATNHPQRFYRVLTP